MKLCRQTVLIGIAAILAAFILKQLHIPAVAAINQFATDTLPHTIIIDAGHGGVDGGATSCTGVLESQINLEIALRLEDLLHLLGYNTKMIRRTDISVHTEGNTIAAKKVSDLKQRVSIVEGTERSILISLHQNQFSDSRYSGAQVFYAREESSKQLATMLQTALVNTLNPGSNRKAKQGNGIYLMEKITNPGILIECGFLSNLKEEALLRDPDYQNKICAVIGATLSTYLEQGSNAS